VQVGERKTKETMAELPKALQRVSVKAEGPKIAAKTA